MYGIIYKHLCLAGKHIIIGMLIILAFTIFAVIFLLGMRFGNFQDLQNLGNLYPLFLQGCIACTGMIAVYTALNASSVIVLDEKAKWYQVLYASPVTVWQEIMSRYILVFLIHTLLCVWTGLLLPFLALAGDQTLGHSTIKALIVIWMSGILLIMLRLPFDILLPSRISNVIVITFTFALLISFITWMAYVADMERIVASVQDGFQSIYDNRFAIIPGIVCMSFAISYYGKKNRRWLS